MKRMQKWLRFWLVFGVALASLAQIPDDGKIYLRNRQNELVAIIEGNVITICPEREQFDLTNYPRREKLMKLIRQGKLSTAVDMLKKFPPQKADSLNDPNADGVTPLMIAAQKGNLEEMKRVFGFGNEFLRDKNGRNALIYALEAGQEKAIRLLGKEFMDLYTYAYIMQKARTLFQVRMAFSAYNEKEATKGRRPAKDAPLGFHDGRWDDLATFVLFAPDDVCIRRLTKEQWPKGVEPYDSPWPVRYDFQNDYRDQGRKSSLLGLVVYGIETKGSVAYRQYHEIPFRKDRWSRIVLLYSLGLRLDKSLDEFEDKYLKPEEREKLQKLMDTDRLPVFAAGHPDYFRYSFEHNHPNRVKAVLTKGKPRVNAEEYLVRAIREDNYKMAAAFKEALKFDDYLTAFIRFAKEEETMKLMPELRRDLQRQWKGASDMKKGMKEVGTLSGSELSGEILGNELSGLAKAGVVMRIQELLRITAMYGRLQVIDELLKCGADMDSPALVAAAENNQCEVIRLFAKRGLNVAKAKNAGQALSKAKPEAAALLRKLGAR